MINDISKGDYLIVVDNDLDTEEMYRFESDNSSIFFYGSDAKFGTWKQNNNLLEVITQGYTGIIVEKYKLENDTWVNVEFPIRKLKKVK